VKTDRNSTPAWLAGGAAHEARCTAPAATRQRKPICRVGTINEMFDRLDDLTAGRDRLTRMSSREADGDPIEDVEALLEHAGRLAAAVDALCAAALAASAHRPRDELATDVGTKTRVFPQPSPGSLASQHDRYPLRPSRRRAATVPNRAQRADSMPA
jgi:hypothetical protein